MSTLYIASQADYCRDHFVYRREMNRRDGSTWKASKPLPNYALRFVIAVCTAIFVVAWMWVVTR